MCGSPINASGGRREARKNVAILFMDLVGSTALAEMLDPESWRQIIDRYFDAAKSAIVAHGGAVEKFIGDAVMAVFGATISHEDDALRAVRAAMEAVAKVGELNVGLIASHKVKLEVRCGICSGEVIAITEPTGDFRVIGDPVNTAARLQTAAEPGQILIDAASAGMVRAVIGLDPVRPLELKGKAQPVPAWLVTGIELPADATVGPAPTPLIGRQHELEQLRSAYRQVTKNNQVGTVTVLGMPGIGKSRLVRDFVESFDPGKVTVLTGRCSAYGRGITYKPLADMLRAWPGGWTNQAARLESGGQEARRAADCLSGIVLDNNESTAELAGVEEISWAVRYLLAQLGKTNPVIMVWEDLHWAESTLLDMIEGMVSWLTNVPVLLICVSRPELLEARPTWGHGAASAPALALEIKPLSYEQSAELVAEIAMHEEVYAHQQDLICEQVARECEGNPLFAELMLDVVAETASSVKLPPPISAVLTARLDQLPHDERQLLEIASVIGRDFSWAALRAMLAAHDVGDSQAQEIAARLARRRLITRVSSDGFRFDHVLMRDTAYKLAPKSRREQLHLMLAERLALLVDGDGNDCSPDDPVALAYHVETANLLRRELRPGDAELPGLAARAAEILIGEGMKALHRNDFPGAAALLDRARGLLPPTDERQLRLMLYISDCWYRLSEPEHAVAALDPGAAADKARGELVCAIVRSTVELCQGLARPEEITARADQFAAQLRGRQGDDVTWCRFHQLLGQLHYCGDRFAKSVAEFKLALDRARAMGDSYEEDKMLGAICELAQWSPTTVTAGLKLCAEMSERFATNGAVLVPVLLTQARLAGLGGDLNGARAALAEAKAHLSDLHLDIADAVVLGVTALVDALAGEHRTAEMSYRRCQGLHLELGRPRDAAAYEAYAARELFEQGKVHEAGIALGRLAEKSHVMDLRTKVVADALGARISAASGRAAQVVDFAASTAELSEQTDDLCLQGNSYSDLAIVAAQAGQQAQAAHAAATALDRYLAKGATRLAVRAERLLAILGDRQPPERSRH
ncbi:MAG TPA: adenylate/guanylate cyclase domain-containing protein [Streptosporangiaceae bacterium]|nr:adenylate/guanylate cyclase domain-containing protein [Streptosporangiaceae bacterium]